MNPFFSFSLSTLFHLLDLLRSSRVACESLYNAGCICEAMSKMARLLITPGKC